MDIRLLSAKVEVTLADISSLMAAAMLVKTRSRTVFYKSAVILMASILELVLFDYVEAQCRHNPKLLKGPKWRYEPVQRLSKKDLDTSKALYIAERVQEKDSLDKIRRDFHSMILFCEDRKLLSKGLCKRLRFAKDKRNEVHLQTTKHNKRTFTKSMVLRIAKTTSVLMKKRAELALAVKHVT